MVCEQSWLGGLLGGRVDQLGPARYHRFDRNPIDSTPNAALTKAVVARMGLLGSLRLCVVGAACSLVIAAGCISGGCGV